MITLLHGDQTEASRKELNRIRENAKHKEVRRFDGRTLDTAKLMLAVESVSMFGSDTLVIIENLFGKLGRKVKLIESLTKILNGSSSDIVLWEDKEVGATVIKNLGKADIRLFKTPAIKFQFLDGLGPHGGRRLMSLYQQLVGSEAPELVFTMMSRRVRNLIQLSNGVTPENLQGWQASRLTRQAKLFTMDKLLSMYNTLLEMEYSVKNGSSPFTITELTEQFLVNL